MSNPIEVKCFIGVPISKRVIPSLINKISNITLDSCGEI